MKKFIFGLIILFSSFSSYAQNSGNTLRFYSNNTAYNHSVKVSEIDSITYDYSSQSQMVHYNERVLPFPISEIDSVVFQDKLNYTIFESIAENVDAILAEDGKALIYGIDSLGNHFLQFEQYDFTNMEWNRESLFVVQFDENNNPISIILNEKVGYLFSYNEEGIDVLFINDDGTFQEFSINETNSVFARRVRYSSRRSSFSDLVTDIERALSVAGLVSALENSAGIGKALAGLGAFGSLIGGDAGTLMSGLSDSFGAAAGSLAARYALGLAIAKALSEWADENVRTERVGNWNVELIKSEQSSYNQCKIEYTISGIRPDPKGNPYYMVYIYASGSGRVCAKFGPYKAENKSETQVFTFSEKGKFDVQIDMYDEKWYWGVFKRSNRETLFMADLQFEKVVISDDYSYSDGSVKYNMNVYIKGDKESLNDVAEYGYYILKPNLVHDYYNATLSAIFASTECTNTLGVDRGYFLTKDYNSFHAEANGYKIGVYVKLKNVSEPLRFDEQEIEGLVYDQNPSVTFTSIQIGTPIANPQYDDDGEYLYTHYSTPFQFNFNVEGAFWINYVQSYCYGGEWTDSEGPVQIVNDGLYENPTNMGYYDDSDMNFSIAYHVHLLDGSVIQSANTVVIGGSPTAPTGHLGGTPSYSRAKVAKRVPMKDKREGNTTGFNWVRNK